MKRFFGTDGVRGRVNEYPITSEFFLKLGLSVGTFLKKEMCFQHKPLAVVAKDTRQSGYMLECAIASGLTAVGFDVFFLGPMPTPAVSMLTTSLRADLGVMISASHNLFSDNGVKFFSPDGTKLGDEKELKIENILYEGCFDYVSSCEIGRIRRVNDAIGRYLEFVKMIIPKDLRLNSFKIVVDCSNGAAYKAAPSVLWELGAQVIPIHVAPNGMNINKRCGALYPMILSQTVISEKADLGIALDGDADRVIFCDEKGEIIQGDSVLGVIAVALKSEGKLSKDTLVTTVMSNYGLEKYLTKHGIFVDRVGVGDRYVMERMLEKGYNFGGEPSGHVILSDFIKTGDGLLTSLKILKMLSQVNKKASEFLHPFSFFPQECSLLEFFSRNALMDYISSHQYQKLFEKIFSEVQPDERLILRPSGTEPLIRVMLEGENILRVKEKIRQITDQLSALKKQLLENKA